MKPLLTLFFFLVSLTSICQPTGYRGVRLNGALMTYETFVYNSPGILTTNSYLTTREKDSLYFAMFYKAVRINYLGSSTPIYVSTDISGNLVKNPITDIFDPSQYYTKTESDARYLQSFTELDPVFSVSPSFGITGTNISNWNTAFGWGNHASAGYATAGNTMTFTNKSGDISQWTNNVGYLTGITSGQVVTALGYTPPNPNGTNLQYIAGDGSKITFPTIPAAQVNSDWNAVSGVAQILNKPTIPTNTNQLTNGAGFLTAEVDGSITNEIELPSQTGNSGRVLSTNGTIPSWISLPSAVGTNNATAYSSGTVYTLTVTSQKVDFGTTDPVVTIPAPGTYIIFTNLKIEYSGLTTLLNACNFKLRRTNNTASDISNATTTFNVVATLLTGTGGDVDIAPVIYTTTNSNDVIELWANRQNGISVTGNINVGEASIVAVRIF